MTEHTWSGWPGAYCLKCGMEDEVEIALADGHGDFYENSEGDEGVIFSGWIAVWLAHGFWRECRA